MRLLPCSFSSDCLQHTHSLFVLYCFWSLFFSLRESIVDGVIYVRVVDPYKASYGVEKPLFAITQLAQTIMRSELGKVTMDDSFENREVLNQKIVEGIGQPAMAVRQKD